MNKKIKLIIILFVLNVLLLIPALNAYMFLSVSTPSNDFDVADIFTTDPVVEVVKNTTENGKPVTVKESIKIQNTGNIPAYLRIKLITYWEDSKGNVVGRASEALSFTTSSDWIYDQKNDVYYYKYVVNPGDTTNEFFADNNQRIIMRHIEETVEYQTITITYDYYQVVEVHVEGIQALPTTAVTKQWDVTIDGNGVITGVTK